MSIDHARKLLMNASHVAAMTGAGISSESGIPTFREAQTGLWNKFSPEQLATPQAFADHPARVWQWYRWRRQQIADTAPNAAHHALAAWEHRSAAFHLATQNVDGLHRRAGSTRVVELHGRIDAYCCAATGRPVTLTKEQAAADEPPPSPHAPDALVRPAVVWFGEALPARSLHEASEAAAACDVYVVIGTSSVVYPAASLALLALEGGAAVIEINPEETPLTAQATVSLRMSAVDALTQL